MRLHHALLLLPLLGSSPALAAPPPTLPLTDVAATTGEHRGRRSMEQHFADANTPHDGHLTLEQAKNGYKSIARSFAQIDVNHRGYITMDDIRAWKAAKKAARQAGRSGEGSRSSEGTRPSRRGADTRATDDAPGTMRPIQVDLPVTPLDRARSS